ncbi:hypothetical protein AN958_06131 [Leucoagaricus sp. SymC.cos]|nr:hypothetical protein AN958_06131 [Leucoagaricus sp. SymC.cos]
MHRCLRSRCNKEGSSAKHYVEIGGVPTADKNREEVMKELVCLKNNEWFLGNFQHDCKKTGVEIADITVSEAFLIQKVGQPSTAAGLDEAQINKAIWLIEPRHTKATEKFTGTLQYPIWTDQTGMTIGAFAHYTFCSSNCQLVLADIQGSYMSIDGHNVLILFDLMMHSMAG